MYKLSYFVSLFLFFSSFSMQGDSGTDNPLVGIVAFTISAAAVLYVQRPYPLQKQKQVKNNKKFDEDARYKKSLAEIGRKCRNLESQAVKNKEAQAKKVFDIPVKILSSRLNSPRPFSRYQPYSKFAHSWTNNSHTQAVQKKIVRFDDNVSIISPYKISAAHALETNQAWFARLEDDSYDTLELEKNHTRLRVAVNKLRLTDHLEIKTKAKLKALIEEAFNDKYVGLNPIIDVELYACQRQIAHTQKILHEMREHHKAEPTSVQLTPTVEKYYEDIIARLRKDEQNILAQRTKFVKK